MQWLDGYTNSGRDEKPPLAESYNYEYVLVRKDFEFIEGTEEMPEHWHYKECKMRKDDYDMMISNNTKFSEIWNALIELADSYEGS